MPFDPTKPANNSDLSSQEVRNQLNGLKSLIDAVPAGPPGPVGPAFSNVQIGWVVTGMAGTGAAVSVNTVGNNVELSFTIPAGEAGPMGEVSSTDMTDAIANGISDTARNPNMVSDFLSTPSDPPTQADLLAVIAKLNELLAALRR